MNHIPTKADLLDMSLWSFADHALELLGKWGQMTAEQQSAMLKIANSIANVQDKEAA
jgi:hypothetical protein